MSATVLSVTLNAAIDQTIALERLERGAVHRARSVRYDAGGKGVNVARCLADWGMDVAATGLLGGDNTAVFETTFRAKGIDDRFVRVPGTTRTNVKLVDDAETTDINLPGVSATPGALEAVDATIAGWAHPNGIAVLAGSLPQGADDRIYARTIERLDRRGVRAVLDATDRAFAHAIESAIPPFCVKPNRDELAAWCGRPLPTMTDVRDVARELRARGIALVVVSLGADGALFASSEGEIVARGPDVAVASTVGAGDAMVAGIVAALAVRSPLADLARLATAFAAAKLTLAGANLPAPDVVHALARDVVLEEIVQHGASVHE